MFGTFFGIHVATSGLRVSQQQLDVVSHNVANANTPGYKRQRAVTIEGNVLSGAFANGETGFSAMGTGVRVNNIERIHVDFVDGRVRIGTKLANQWNTQSQSLGMVEDIFGEPGDNGLQNSLDQFWNSWDKVTSLPENAANRIAVVNQAEALAESIRIAYKQLDDYRRELDFGYQDKANRVNLLADQIAELNIQISAPTPGNYTPNELLNQRDLLVEQLSEITGVQQFGESGMDFVLTLDGRALVSGSVVNRVELGQTADGMAILQWASDHQVVNVDSGELTGLQTVRDQNLPAYMSQLNDLTTTLISEVNALHSTGFALDGVTTGQDFFVAGGTAATIALNPAVKANFNLIQASADGMPGNGQIAFDIAGLRSKLLGGGISINQMYRKMISGIAGDASIANQQAEQNQAMLDQARVQQQSVSGVSMDEEMTDMIRFQQAYNAAARIVTAMDEMLDTLINQTGLVGR